MRLSSSFVAPSAIAVVSTILLSGPAISQTATGSGASLPSITVVAPKQVARPHRPERVAPRRTSSTAHRPTAQTSTAQTSTAQTSTARRPIAQTSRARPREIITGATPEAVIAGPGSPLGKLARLEKMSSSCNGGCATSFRVGNEPWVGCSESAGYLSVFSGTCRDTLTYASYVGCMDTKMFTGWERNRAWWYCNSLLAGKRFKVAELKRSRR
jgi:hypothetical protein